MTKQAAINKAFIAEKNGRSFVLYGGLLDSAHDGDTLSINTELVQIGTEENGREFICKAYVTTPKGTFTGYGDASPQNVSRAMLTCLLRLAETRAKARALRDAINAAGVLLAGDADDDLPEYQPDQDASRAQAGSQDARARANTRNEPAAEPAKPIARAEPTLARAPGPPTTATPQNLPAKATEQQVEAIYHLGESRHHLDRVSVETDCMLRFAGLKPAALDVVQAGAYIKRLQMKELSQ